MQYLKRLDYIDLCKLLKSEILILFCAAAPGHQDSPTYSSEFKTVQKFNEHLLKKYHWPKSGTEKTNTTRQFKKYRIKHNLKISILKPKIPRYIRPCIIL